MSEVKNGKYVEENGSIFWYENDQLHRLDGHAVEDTNGSKRWFQNDKIHRENGPAIETSWGHKEWYLYGVKYTEEEFNQWLEKKSLNKKLENSLDSKPKEKKKKI